MAQEDELSLTLAQGSPPGVTGGGVVVTEVDEQRPQVLENCHFKLFFQKIESSSLMSKCRSRLKNV